MKHYKIEIKVAYDEATVSNPDELKWDLYREVDYSIQDGMLTPGGEVVLEELNVNVEEVS